MLLPTFEFHEPRSIEEALTLKRRFGAQARFLAGGTDLLVHLKKRLFAVDHLISLDKVPSLARIGHNPDAVEIGSCVTMSAITHDPVIQERFSALRSGAGNLGNHLIRNRATIGGNVCNASPAGDTLPALVIYGAVVLLESPGGKREVLIEDFFKGPGKTDIRVDELLTGFRLPIPPAHSGAHYIQLGKRKSSEINVVNVASFLEYSPATGKVVSARIALGSVAPTPIRSVKAEAALKDRVADSTLFTQAAEIARFEDCKPIDDFRGSAGYRRAMVGILTRRTLTHAFEQAKATE